MNAPVTGVERREFPVWYPGGGMLQDPANQFTLTLLRGMYAYSLMADMDEDKRGKYLDVGSGGGFITELVGAGFAQAVGYERRPEAIAYAKLMHNRANVKYVSTWEEVEESGPYDFVTFLDVIEHMPKTEAAEMLSRIHKAMSPEGVLHITTPIALTKDGSNPYNPYHIHEYTPPELNEMLTPLFKDVRINRLGARTFQAVCFGKSDK